MPAKKNNNRNNSKSVPMAEAKRRAAQSARDKAQSKKMPSTPRAKPKKRTGFSQSYVPNVRTGNMSRLAMSLSAPQYLPPMRLPTVSRQKTDVKHLWDTSAYTVNSKSGTWLASCVGTMNENEMLQEFSAFYALTRDLVTPLYIPMDYWVTPGGGSVTSSFSFNWIPFWPDPTSFWNVSPSLTNIWSQPVPIVFPGTATTAGETFTVSPPTSLSHFGPVQVAANNSHTAGFVPQNLPAARDENGDMYGWHSVGSIVATLRLIDNAGNAFNIPTGASATIIITLDRYRGPQTSPECSEEAAVVIPATVSSGSITFTNPPAGYYRVSTNNITYFANTTTTTLGIAYQLNVRSVAADFTVGARGYGIFPAVNLSLPSATYILERSRVNSASLLIKNVSSNVAKAGEIWGVREAGKENFFTFMTPSLIYSLAGASGTAYYGALETGCYTFLEPPPTADVLYDYSITLGGVYGGVTLPIANLTCMSVPHVIYARWPVTNTGVAQAYPTMLTCRVDTHVEFISNSQLATLGITSDPVSEYTDATIVLSAGSYFYENPTHLEQLWGWIKRTGAAVIRAGASAAARTALEAGTLALGTMF